MNDDIAFNAHARQHDAETHPSQYVALWRSVLLAGIGAAMGVQTRAYGTGMTRAARTPDPRDRAWIGSRDFAAVCDFAYIDPTYMRDRLLPRPAAA